MRSVGKRVKRHKDEDENNNDIKKWVVKSRKMRKEEIKK